MSIPRAFEDLLAHPAPGLHFPAHPGTRTDEYILPCPHRPGTSASAAQLAHLRKLTALAPQVQAQLLQFYGRWDGVELCCLADPCYPGTSEAALTLLCLDDLCGLTEELLDDASWLLDSLGDMYVPGNFVVIASSPEEATRLTLFMAGEYEGQPLAGRIFYVSMDPVLSFTKPLAESFDNLLSVLGTDIAAFLRRIAYCHAVYDREGQLYGSVPDRYIPDSRGLPNLGFPKFSKKSKK
jgi:hypothetical protein